MLPFCHNSLGELYYINRDWFSFPLYSHKKSPKSKCLHFNKIQLFTYRISLYLSGEFSVKAVRVVGRILSHPVLFHGSIVEKGKRRAAERTCNFWKRPSRIQRIEMLIHINVGKPSHSHHFTTTGNNPPARD